MPLAPAGVGVVVHQVLARPPHTLGSANGPERVRADALMLELHLRLQLLHWFFSMCHLSLV